jgi:homeobox protein YOX1/YHP1
MSSLSSYGQDDRRYSQHPNYAPAYPPTMTQPPMSRRLPPLQHIRGNSAGEERWGLPQASPAFQFPSQQSSQLVPNQYSQHPTSPVYATSPPLDGSSASRRRHNTMGPMSELQYRQLGASTASSAYPQFPMGPGPYHEHAQYSSRDMDWQGQDPSSPPMQRQHVSSRSQTSASPEEFYFSPLSSSGFPSPTLPAISPSHIRTHSSDSSTGVTGLAEMSGARRSTSPDEPRPKRRRADAAQLKILTETYARTAFPTTEERNELAKILHMSPRQVQIW